MQTVLITGAARTTGANLAVSLSRQFRVVAADAAPRPVAGCRPAGCDLSDRTAARRLLAAERPDVVVHCGAAADSSWMPGSVRADDVRATRNLAAAAQDAGCRLVVISSDQVYSGPWMFHDESSMCLSHSDSARAVLEAELVALAVPGALVVRTHAVGWSPDSSGLLEVVAEACAAGTPLSYTHFATPIAATRLAEMLSAAIQQGLSGLFNVAGAERTSLFGFAAALARELDCPRPEPAGAGLSQETTLRSRRICQRLSLPLPMLGETVERLAEEREKVMAALAGARPAAFAA